MKLRMRGSNSSVNIDGRSFSGKNVSIVNGKVTIDGVLQDGELTGDVNITVHGDVEKLENSCGEVRADSIGSVKTQSGDVVCGDVSGSVTTMSGDVNCNSIHGNCSTMSGDIG